MNFDYVDYYAANYSNASFPSASAIEPYSTVFVIFLWILTSVFCVETIFGNLLVLCAYKLERNIRRQISNKFIVSLAISDLIIGAEGFPFLTVYVVELELWPLGTIMCQIWLCIDYTLCLVSILTVLLITVDRYCSVCYPAKYRMWQTENKINLMIVLSWVVPFGLFALLIFGWEAMTNENVNDPMKCYAPFLNDPYVNMSMYIVYYWTTLVAMSVLYRGIHKAARTLEEKSKAKEKQTMALLLGQRCMAQVGVGIYMHAQSQAESEDHREETSRLKNEYTAEYTELVHDSGYITTGNTTTTTTTTTGTAHQTSCDFSHKEIPEEEIVEVVEPHDKTPVPPKADLEAEDLLHFDDEITPEEEEENEPVSELRGSSSKDTTPTQVDVPIMGTLSRNSSYKKFHTRLSLRLKHQDSGCSLEFYDNCSCGSSMFADSSITSVLDFEAILPILDFFEEVSLVDVPMFPADSEAASVHTLQAETTQTSSVSQTPKTSAVAPTLDMASVNKLIELVAAKRKNNQETMSSEFFPDTLPRTPIDPPSSNNYCTEDADCGPSVVNLTDKPVEMGEESKVGEETKRLLTPPPLISNPSKQSLLTVPKQSALNRQRQTSTKAPKTSVDESWKHYRQSWQSTLSPEESEKLQLAASKKDHEVDDDEDSLGSKQEIVSSGEDSSSEKRTGSWVATLFTNPTWLLHRRRKVTKAEQRAHKAFRTITVIVGTFALFWSPYYIVATIYGFCPDCVPTALFFTSYYLCYLNSSMNPFAYAFANRLFRKTFVRILRGDFRST